MNIKKLTIIISLALCLAGCGGGGSSPTLPSNTPLQENNNIETEVQINRYVPK